MQPPRPLRLGAAPPEADGSPGTGGGATPDGMPAGASALSGPGCDGVGDLAGPGSLGAEDKPESGASGVGGVSGSVTRCFLPGREWLVEQTLKAGKALSGSHDGHRVPIARPAAQPLDRAGDADGGDHPTGAVPDRGGNAGDARYPPGHALR